MYVTEQLARENGRDYALRTLKENIIRLELEPGSSISDREVASQLSLSRTPVREALLELAKSKVIDIYPQKGSVVSLIDYELVEEAYFIRNVLETAVIELACRKASQDSLEELKSNIKLQWFYHQERALDKLMELDDEFHCMLFKITGKMQTYEMMKGMMVHFDRVRNMALGTMKSYRRPSKNFGCCEKPRYRPCQEAYGKTFKAISSGRRGGKKKISWIF